MITSAQTKLHAICLTYTTLAGFLLISLAGPWIPAAIAFYYPLVDKNAQLDIETSQRATGFNWYVDGKDHMTEFSNWYRIGNAFNSFEQSIHPLMVGTPLHQDLDLSNEDESLTVEYLSPGNFHLVITYGVYGGGIGTGYSEMGECFTLTNLRGGNLDFHFYEYMNLDLDESSDDLQAYADLTRLYQYDDATTFDVSRGTSSHYEIEYFSFTEDHLSDPSSMSPPSRSILNDNPLAGPGDLTLALQWDINLPQGGVYSFCKDCKLQMIFSDVPEPASMALLLMGGILAIRMRQRTRR